MTTHSVDDLLVKDMQNQQAPVQAIPNPISTPEPVQEEAKAEAVELPADAKVQDESEVPHGTNEQKENKDTVSKDTNKDAVSKDTKIDEYGNPIEPPRTYTEDEVQRMIRERLSRGRHTEQPQPTQQQVQKAAEDFKADPNSEEPWQVQLENFMDNWASKRETKLKQEEWKQHEAQKQADFEAKFNTGMGKYQDFEQVVGRVGQSITPSMMLATRSLDNPAAFLYAAAKLHPGELDRIGKINDTFVQAAEIGRLHERMVKTRNGVSGAPKPIDAPKGDIPNKPLNNERSLDQRIFDYAKQKRR